MYAALQHDVLSSVSWRVWFGAKSQTSSRTRTKQTQRSWVNSRSHRTRSHRIVSLHNIVNFNILNLSWTMAIWNTELSSYWISTQAYYYYYCLCIIWCRCIIGVITYFVAGILIMKFYKKASGTDIIPNKVFWKSAPFLIKVIKSPPPLLNLC